MLERVYASPRRPWLSALQPELFVDLSPEHAREIGLVSLETVQIATPRAAIRTQTLVTSRIRPFLIDGKVVHHVGMSWRWGWGYEGISKGDVVNDLAALVGDPNVTIPEAKVLVCRVEKLAAAGKSEGSELQDRTGRGCVGILLFSQHWGPAD